MDIRQLERELGVPIVKRGQRFAGFTEEGERVLAWALRIVEAKDGLLDDLAGLAGEAGGRLVLGVIPSALPVIPPLTAAIRAAAPRAGVTILAQSSRQIDRGWPSPPSTRASAISTTSRRPRRWSNRFM